MSMGQGGLTVVEKLNSTQEAPSFLVTSVIAQANPTIAQAQPGSLVLVIDSNYDKRSVRLICIFRITEPGTTSSTS